MLFDGTSTFGSGATAAAAAAPGAEEVAVGLAFVVAMFACLYFQY